MSTINPEKLAHSANVQMHLSLGDQVLGINQLGPDFVILENPIDHPACMAEIFLSVDGQQSRWQVHLFEGLSASQARARIACSG